MDAVGAFFRGARLAAGLRTEQVALAMGEVMGSPVSPATIYKIEGARVNPGLDLVLALLHVLAVDPRALLAVARSDMSKHRAEEVGRTARYDDAAWIDSLSDGERAYLLRFLDDTE